MDTYQVGYSKPPKHAMFKKGKSGNPKGRPKTPITFQQSLIAELKSPITITEGGKKKKISKMEALLKTMLTGALKGDAKFLRLITDALRKLPANAFDSADGKTYVWNVSAAQEAIISQFLSDGETYESDVAHLTEHDGGK